MSVSAFIWDLDGTLLDSYELIVSGLYKTYREYGVTLDKELIHREVIIHTVGEFITKMEAETGLPFDLVKPRFSAINERGKLEIRPIPHAAEILADIKAQGIPNFVFTHRGTSTEPVLRNTGLYDYFEEIITGRDGFGRKPDPAAILYLIRKHHLDKSRSFYVGDRTLDVECAVNAGIQSILYLQEGSPAIPSGKENYLVRDLLDIKRIYRSEF